MSILEHNEYGDDDDEDEEDRNVKRNKIHFQDVVFDETFAPNCCFREELIIVDDTGETVGYLKVNIGLAQLCDQVEFTVHASSKLNTDEEKANMTFTSRVRPTLTTVEEKRKEYSKMKDFDAVERTLYMAKIEDNYLISSSIKKGRTRLRQRREDLGDELYNFMSEGANMLLLRSIAVNGLLGKLKTKTALVNGEICKSFIISEFADFILDGRKLSGMKVTRYVRGQNGIIQKMYTWLNRSGQILLHKWEDSSNGICQLSMKMDRQTLQAKCPGDLSTPLIKSWQDDLQLTSLYIDRAEKLKREYASYILDNPQVAQLLSELVLFLLMEKPEDVIDFAVNFFLQFVPLEKTGDIETMEI